MSQGRHPALGHWLSQLQPARAGVAPDTQQCPIIQFGILSNSVSAVQLAQVHKHKNIPQIALLRFTNDPPTPTLSITEATMNIISSPLTDLCSEVESGLLDLSKLLSQPLVLLAKVGHQQTPLLQIHTVFALNCVQNCTG